MRVRAWKTVEVEVEVDIDVEQITASIDEAIADANEYGGISAITTVVNRAWQSLKAITPEMIEKVSRTNRIVIAEALQKQVDRWSGNADV